MKRLSEIGVVAVIGLMVAADASATTLASAGISFLHTIEDRLTCTVTNVGTKPITLEGDPRIFGAQSDNSGEEIVGTSCTPLAPMLPGSSCAVSTGPSASCFTCYCTVSFTGSKKSVRAVLTRNVNGATVAAVPLQ